MEKKRLLISGGGYAELPLINSAKKLGYYVITTGNRPEELGHKVSNEYHCVDFSDLEAMLNLANKLKIDAICPGCNDFSALSSAYVAEQLGLPGHDSYETSRLLHHKDRYRTFASANNIPTPNAKSFSDIPSALSAIKNFQLPVLVKPIDLTGGKGISKINHLFEAKQALKKAFAVSKLKRIIIEEFVTGSQHGFSAFLHNEQVVFFFSDNEHYFKNPYLVSAASTPSIISSKVEERLCLESEKIARLLSLKTGIFHVQYILRKGEPIIIEICRRAPGDLYIKLVEYATGVLYSDWIVKAFAGLNCEGLFFVKPKGFFTRHCVMSAQPGKVKNVVFDTSTEKNIIDKVMWWKKGDLISDVMTAKFGITFLKFDTMAEMLTQTEQMQELIRVEVE